MHPMIEKILTLDKSVVFILVTGRWLIGELHGAALIDPMEWQPTMIRATDPDNQGASMVHILIPLPIKTFQLTTAALASIEEAIPDLRTVYERARGGQRIVPPPPGLPLH